MLRTILRHSIKFVPWGLRPFIKHVPGLAVLQRFLLHKSLEGAEFIHTIDAGPARGLKYPISLPQDKNVWTGTYESVFSNALSGSVRQGDVCFDVGSWRGFFSGVFALAGASRVYAFEPLPENAAHVRRLQELNPDLPITLFEAAVGENSGEMDFSVLPASSMGKLAASSFQPDVLGSRQIRVRVVSLDSLFFSSQIDLPAVMKIDVEGAEMSVLNGAREVIVRAKPRMFIEVHSRDLAFECHDFLTSHGYQIKVAETQGPWDRSYQPDICHFIGVPKFSSIAPLRSMQ